MNDRNIANYAGPSFTVGEPDHDSDQVLLLVNYLLQLIIYLLQYLPCINNYVLNEVGYLYFSSNFRNFHFAVEEVRVNVVVEVVVFCQRLRHQWVA